MTSVYGLRMYFDLYLKLIKRERSKNYKSKLKYLCEACHVVVSHSVHNYA